VPPLLNVDELHAVLHAGFPGTAEGGLVVEALDGDAIRIRMRTTESNLRPGATLSGPTLFTLVDTVAWLLTVAHLGPGRDAVTAGVSMEFLRRPSVGDLLGEGRLLKLGRRTAVTDVLVRSDGDDRPCAHATVTYAPL
jgi:uncharacterized protein (TIGR00369 family)